MCKNSGFRSRIQKSYKKFGIESKNLIIFSESIPNLLPPPLLPWAHTDRTDLTFFVGGKSHGGWGVGNLTDALLLCFQRLTRIQREDYLLEFVLICG